MVKKTMTAGQTANQEGKVETLAGLMTRNVKVDYDTDNDELVQIAKRYGNTLRRNFTMPVNFMDASKMEDAGLGTLAYEVEELLSAKFEALGQNAIFSVSYEFDDQFELYMIVINAVEKDVYKAADSVVEFWCEKMHENAPAPLCIEMSEEESEKIKAWGVQTFIEYILDQMDIQMTPEDAEYPAYDMLEGWHFDVRENKETGIISVVAMN